MTAMKFDSFLIAQEFFDTFMKMKINGKHIQNTRTLLGISQDRCLVTVSWDDLNRIKMRNWYILSPMKIPKQQFYNFWVKFSICKYHTRRNFINFWLRKGGKKIWIFAGFPDYWLKTDSEEASEFRVYKKCSQD